MNSLLFYLGLALVAGICIPVQAGINAQLNLYLRSSILAAGVSFAVGTLTLIAYTLVARIPLPASGTLTGAPWWVWSGGVLGAFFVAATVVLAPKVGATNMLGLVLAGQMLASLLLDHYGLFGYPLHPFSLMRLLGVVLIVAGVFLVRLF